jgi:hypothetical protein
MEKFCGFKTRDGKFFEVAEDASKHEAMLSEKEANLNKEAEAISMLWTYKKIGLPPPIDSLKLALTALTAYECGSIKYLDGLAKTTQFRETYDLYRMLKGLQKEFLLVKDYL